MLGIGLTFKQGLDHARSRRADRFSPVQQALRGPIGVFTVGNRHVFDHRGVLSPLWPADVTGNPLALVETFHRAYGQAHVHLRFDQPIRYGVIMPLDFNVIIDMNPRLFPFGEFIRDAGQRAQRGLLLGDEQGLS